MENKSLERVRAFLQRTDLTGTELLLKNRTMNVDAELQKASTDMNEAGKLFEEKRGLVQALSQRLDELAGMVDLAAQATETVMVPVQSVDSVVAPVVVDGITQG